MLWSPKFSLSNMRVRLTAKGLLRNIRLPSGYKKSTVIFHTEKRLVKAALAKLVSLLTSPIPLFVRLYRYLLSVVQWGADVVRKI
ncbi:hypothetical protein Q9233_004996 [Columba guinea]|nr:hypothetical protein Q9233_004996 [Columba guinea]